MAWIADPTWSVGQVSLAQDWNLYVAGNLQAIGNPPVCRVSLFDTYITVAALGTLIPYVNVLEDTRLGFNTQTSLYTVPVAGEYFVSADISVSSGTDTGYFTAYVYQNGAPIEMGAGQFGATGIGLTARATGFARCAVGDTIGGYYDASSTWLIAGENNYATRMSIAKVSN